MARHMKFASVLAISLALPALAFAHHGWSSYNEKQTLKITAPLKEVTWGNPHGMAKVAYKGKDWVVVLAPTTRMESRGLTQAMLAPAKTVTIEGYARIDGTPEMRIERVIAEGKTVELR